MRLIGSPFYLQASAQIEAAPLWERWADQVTSITRAAQSEAELGRLLAEWSDRASEDRDIADSLYRVSMHGHMAGQLFVREVEVPEAHEVKHSLDSATVPPFLSQAFAEAVEAFQSRRIVSPAEWQALSAEARRRAFGGVGFASEHVTQRVYDLLLRSLREGGSLQDFQRQVRAEDLGITSSNPGYLETVYRTTVQSAYGAGRLRQLESPAVVAARPFVEYRTAGDNRVRPAHRLLDGKIFDRRKDAEWRRYAPPNSWNCRCSVVAIKSDRVDPSRVISSSDPPTATLPNGKTVIGAPDPEWDSAPDYGLPPPPPPESAPAPEPVPEPEPEPEPTPEPEPNVPPVPAIPPKLQVVRERVQAREGDTAPALMAAEPEPVRYAAYIAQRDWALGSDDDLASMPYMALDRESAVYGRELKRTAAEHGADLSRRLGISVDDLRDAARAQYAATQEALRRRGITGQIDVMRGVYGRQADDIAKAIERGDKTFRLQIRPLSSWTVDRDIAIEFATGGSVGAIIEHTIPVEQAWNHYAIDGDQTLIPREQEVVATFLDGYIEIDLSRVTIIRQ